MNKLRKNSAMLQTRLSKLFILILLVFLTATNQSNGLSPQAKISLLSVGPGEELYAGFGHSALWVFDLELQIDRVYHYGTFDFDSDFYMKFVRGKLDYRISVSDMYSFMYNYHEENRSVGEQQLNISHKQKEEIFAFLEKNNLPENRYYRYDFFFDNCSTRIRDLMTKVLNDSIQFNTTNDLNYSPRQMIDLYLQDKKIQDLGMDIGLGAPADKKLVPYGYMFLPDFLKSGFDSAQVYNTGKWQPLVLKNNILFQAIPVTKAKSLFSPMLFCWFLFLAVAIITYLQIDKYHSFYIDAFWLIATGILGIVLVGLWFFTDHNVTINNWDLCWATPLHIPVAVFLIRRNNTKFLSLYFIAYAGVCTLLIVFWKIIPEELNPAVLPLILIFLLRAVNISYYFHRNRIAKLST